MNKLGGDTMKLRNRDISKPTPPGPPPPSDKRHTKKADESEADVEEAPKTKTQIARSASTASSLDSAPIQIIRRKKAEPVVESESEDSDHGEDCECDECIDEIEEDHDEDCDCEDCEFIDDDDEDEEEHDEDCECDDCIYEGEEEEEEEDEEDEELDDKRKKGIGLLAKLIETSQRRTSLRKETPAVQEYVKLKNKLDEMFTADENEEIRYFKELPEPRQKEILSSMTDRLRLVQSGIPMRFQIMDRVQDPEIQRTALTKYEAITNMEPGSPEYFKMMNWLDGFMRIPFGTYRSLPVSLSDGEDKCRDFMKSVRSNMDAAVFGQDTAKLQIMQFVAQWIANPTAAGNVLAIHGPAGVGKTTLIKEGVAKALGRPFHFIALGGATDSSHLEGHSYTYEGSVWGRLADILMTSKCMNPVIFFDELDKVSETPKGEEIINILMHLTDSAQNERIADKYFAGIPLDFSKCLFFFSMNNKERVNPILLDRAYVLGIDAPDKTAKITIARDYLMPVALSEMNLVGQVTIPDDTVRQVIDEYTKGEAGVRELKRCLFTILSKINMLRFMNGPELPFYIKEFKLPFVVNREHLTKLLVQNGHRIDPSIAHMYT